MSDMKKKGNTYILFGILLMLVLGICGCGKKEEAYRVIKIMTLEGTAKVTRESVGELDAYVDMRLESGDELAVAHDSNLVLNLDDDKYVLLEPGTKMKLLAEGTSQDSRTEIQLMEGAVVNQIMNTLNENSSYEVTAPNSTMAVRGTVFRVSIEYSEDGDSYAAVTVLEGTVASRLVYPDGTIQTQEEEREIPKGMQVHVHGNDEISEYYPYELEEVNLEEYSVEALEFLEMCLEHNEELYVTKEELVHWIEIVKEKEENASEESKISEPDAVEAEEQEQPETPEEVKEGDEADLPLPKPAEVAQKEQETPVVLLPVNEPQSSHSSSKHHSSGSSSSNNSGSGGSSTGSSGSGGSSTDKPSTDKPSTDTPSTGGDTPATDEPVTKSSYTVTFTYNNSTFCTQTVENGETAVTPSLMPTAAGSWNFDFTNPITANTTIEWKSDTP